MAFLISPMGLPLAAIWLLGKVQSLKFAIQDYDDWSLNGDIIVYYPVLDMAFEISSMGIRVDEKALKEQLEKAGCPERENLPFQKEILEKKLPYTIGGGIGQSRICMFFLKKAHIGEVQASIWPDDVWEEASKKGLNIL